MFAKLTGCLLLLLAFGAVQARADSVYEITGTMTIPGNAANPGVSERIKFSFELDYSQLNAGYFPTVVGTPVVTSYGPLGDFSMASGPSSQGYMGFFSPSVNQNGYAEFDLMGNFTLIGGGPPVPSITGETWFYTCSGNPACSEFNYQGGENEYFNTATATIRAVPEPGTLCLFVLGALALCLMKKTLAH